MQDPLVVFVVMIAGAAVLFFTGILIVSISILIQVLALRLMGSSANIEKIYRTHQRPLDTLFCATSVAPALIASYYWGAYFVAPFLLVITRYASQYTAIGTTAVMCIILVLTVRKFREAWLEAREGYVSSE